MRILLFIFLFFVVSSFSFADTIVLKNGNKIKVESMTLEGNTVNCKILGGEVSFKISEIADIEQSKPNFSEPIKNSKKETVQKEEFSEARKMAMEAYKQAANNPFNAHARTEALRILKKARDLDPEEAEIFLTEAVMILQDGYRHGPWYKAWAYGDGIVDTAIYKINYAISVDPNYYRSYTMLAWMFIIKSEFDRSEELLEQAYKLNGESFYYWLYKGTLSQEKKEYDNAQNYYSMAEKYADDDGMSMLRDRRKEIAKETGNFEEAEQYYLDEISNDPDNAYSYGNYAGFLLCTGRFDEAIGYYEKAISIKPYPKVLLGLQIAKMRNKDAAKCLDNKVQI